MENSIVTSACLQPQEDVENVALTDLDDIEEDDSGSEWKAPRDSMHAKDVRAYVACYSWIDNAKTRVLVGKLNPRELATEVRQIINARGREKAAIVRQLYDHYKELLSEAKDDEYIADWIPPLTTIVETIGLMVSNKAAVKASARGAKSRKMHSTIETMDLKGEKAASKVAYKATDDSLGISSIDPTNIVGSEITVLFNTKNRRLEVYRAKEGQKLSVHGMKITNYDEQKSVGKTIRKPEEVVQGWIRATTVKRTEVLLSGINGKSWELTGKMNKNTLVIKVL